MRTTVRIDDDLLAELKERAAKEKVSLAEMVNRELRSVLGWHSDEASRRRRYREKPVALGEAKIELTKSLRLAVAHEDDEVERKL